MSNTIHRTAEERAVPGSYDLAILNKARTPELVALSKQLDSAQEVFHARGSFACDWLAAQCRQLAAQREDPAREERSWEMPRHFYTNPATLAKAMREIYTVRDVCDLTKGQVVILSAVLQDLHIFADHYLTNYDDRG